MGLIVRVIASEKSYTRHRKNAVYDALFGSDIKRHLMNEAEGGRVSSPSPP